MTSIENVIEVLSLKVCSYRSSALCGELWFVVSTGEGSKAKGRSRKWKEMLKLPGVAEAMSLDREISE